MLEALKILLYVVFSFSALLLIIVILLQEGKGGGLAAAFGGAGADTFGVGSGGINRFTSILAAVWIGSAVILAAIPEPGVRDTSKKEQTQEPSAPDGGGTEAPDGGSQGGDGG